MQFRDATAVEMAFLKARGLVNPFTRNATLCGVEVAAQLLAEIGASPAVVADLQGWHRRATGGACGASPGAGPSSSSRRGRSRGAAAAPPVALELSSEEEEIYIGNSTSSSNSSSSSSSSSSDDEEYEGVGRSKQQQQQQPSGPPPPAFNGVIPQDLPTTLPTDPPRDGHHPLQRTKYGLSQLTGKVAWAQEALDGGVTEGLRVMEVFFTTPINTMRHSSHLGANTWPKHVRGIMCFLAFVLLHVGVMPSLLCYLDAHALVAYLAHLLQTRGVGKATLCFHVETALKVVEWLMATGQVVAASGVNAGRVGGYKQWLLTLNNQLRLNVVQPREGRGVADLQEQGRWLDAGVLMVEVKHVVDGALQALSQGGAWTVNLAAQVMNAALCALCFGYVPPIRPSIIISLVLPGYLGPCIHQDCQHPRCCKGNRLEYGPNGDSLLLVAPHHKNTKRWKGKVISFELPPELFTLLHAHIQGGHVVLTRCLPDGQGEVDPRVFVLESTGQPLSPANVSQLWCRTALSRVQARFGPQMCRSIFVHERRSSGRVGGPEDDAAAHVMGNSLSTWDAVYDRSYDRRRAQGAVDAMQQWRAGVLADAAVRAAAVAAVEATVARWGAGSIAE